MNDYANYLEAQLFLILVLHYSLAFAPSNTATKADRTSNVFSLYALLT